MRHRHDIQGLRAVAVLLVVLDHAGVKFLSGGFVGVDVFFVLSGFLITGLLLSRAEKYGYVSLSEFYIRRARRILPAAVLTLIVTDLVAYQLLNFIRAREVVTDSIWAAFFAANVHFAREGTDYFAQWQPPSPLQHFWTLAVEEQFYLVWPALLSFALFGTLFRRRRGTHSECVGRNAIRRLFFVTVLAGTASLAWSIYSTESSPTAAYFSTFARAWELALGAALAIATSTIGEARLMRTRGVQTVLGWAGLIGIACAAVLFSGNTLVPGYAALLPAVGSALVIAAGLGSRRSRFHAARFLSLAPLRYVGDRSYAYYLWHWPVLIIAAQYAGHNLSLATKLLLCVGAFALSIVSYRLFENPIRRMHFRAPAGILLWPASAAAVVGVALFILGSIDTGSGRLGATAANAAPAPLRDPSVVAVPAAAVTRAGAPLPAVVAAVNAAHRSSRIPAQLVPPVRGLLKDGYSFPPGCAPDSGQTSSNVCRIGDTSSAKTLVVMGDSFVQQWMPAVLPMALKDNWVVIPLVNASGCGASAWLRYPSRPWCPTWYRWALGQAAKLHPDVTLISGEWGSDAPASAPDGALAMTNAAKRFSKSVIIVGVAPLQTRQPVDCLLARHATMRTCTTVVGPEATVWDDRVSAFADAHGIGFIDTKPWFCARPSSDRIHYWCPLVINRTITKRDTGHVTSVYAKELAASFRSAFRRELFR